MRRGAAAGRGARGPGPHLADAHDVGQERLVEGRVGADGLQGSPLVRADRRPALGSLLTGQGSVRGARRTASVARARLTCSAAHASARSSLGTTTATSTACSESPYTKDCATKGDLA